jgi:hypothetical protein
MPRRRLTNEERSIRRGRGIPIVRIVPFLAMAIAFLIMSSDSQLFRECLGRPLDGGGKAGALVRMVAAIPCSPYYLRHFDRHWIVIVAFFLGTVFAPPQIFWIRHHTAYWNAVRERERLKRQQKVDRSRTGFGPDSSG